MRRRPFLRKDSPITDSASLRAAVQPFVKNTDLHYLMLEAAGIEMKTE